VFHADLPALQHALALHGIPYADMNLSQCLHALIHHIITSTCFENPSNARETSSSTRHELSACRVLSQGFSCTANVPEAVLNVILGANHNQMSTEYYCHVAAAKNITVSGSRNLQFKLRAVIRSSLAMFHLADSGQSSCVSVADFFNSFESHCKSVLIAIAVLHRIQLPSKPTVHYTR
jgi:hypothetical protein